MAPADAAPASPAPPLPSSEAPAPAATSSHDTAAAAAEAAAALALVASHLRPSELPKLALAARAVELGAAGESETEQAQPGDAARVLALISNVESGREESALLLLRPRRRNASRATCEAVLPVLPALRLACVRYSAAAGALDIEALLARGIELPPHRAEQDGEWLLAAASGPQWLALRSRDTQGVRDLIVLLQGHKESSASASASTSPPRPTHAWLAAYHDDVLPASAPPLFSRFASQPPLEARPPRSSSPPPDELRLVVGTYNAAGLGPLHSPGARHARARWLAKAARAADLLAIALQEGEISQTAYLYHSPGIKEAWAAELSLALGEEAPDFDLAVAEQHAHLFLFLFVRRPATDGTVEHPAAERLLRAPPATEAIGVGLGGWLANKGAIGASLRLSLPGAAADEKAGPSRRKEVSVAIVATHLPAFEGAPAREARREAWREIERRLLFPSFSAPDSPAAAAAADDSRNEIGIMDHDLVIVAGDVNSRLALNNAEVRRVLRREARSPRASAAAGGPTAIGAAADAAADEPGAPRPAYEETLLHFDELRQEMKAGGAWQEWQEMPIAFEPTYKYDLETDVFDTSVKQRTPGWTDRVLWHLPTAAAAALEVRGVEYASEPALRTSDHRPVRAVLALRAGAGE